MKDLELEHFKSVLTNQLNSAEQPLRRREEIAIESAPDELDRVQNGAAREMAIRQLESDALRLYDLRAALSRIRDGSYGTCLRCDEPISGKRLAAIPWASYCVKCQAIVDEERKELADQEQLAHL
jgi:DnaK suppressor protein